MPKATKKTNHVSNTYPNEDQEEFNNNEGQEEFNNEQEVVNEIESQEDYNNLNGTQALTKKWCLTLNPHQAKRYTIPEKDQCKYQPNNKHIYPTLKAQR